MRRRMSKRSGRRTRRRMSRRMSRKQSRRMSRKQSRKQSRKMSRKQRRSMRRRRRKVGGMDMTPEEIAAQARALERYEAERERDYQARLDAAIAASVDEGPPQPASVASDPSVMTQEERARQVSAFEGYEAERERDYQARLDEGIAASLREVPPQPTSVAPDLGGMTQEEREAQRRAEMSAQDKVYAAALKGDLARQEEEEKARVLSEALKNDTSEQMRNRLREAALKRVGAAALEYQERPTLGEVMARVDPRMRPPDQPHD